MVYLTQSQRQMWFVSGQGWDQYWMYGISELYTKTNNANGEPYELYARYGFKI